MFAMIDGAVGLLASALLVPADVALKEPIRGSPTGRGRPRRRTPRSSTPS